MTPSKTVTPSKGFAFSITMLVFMLIEIGVLADIESQYINTMMLLLFSGLGLLALLQFAGIFGGLAAYRYPERLAKLDRSAAPDRPNAAPPRTR